MANKTETSFNLEETSNPNNFSPQHPIISDSEEKTVLGAQEHDQGFNNLSIFEENRFLYLQGSEIFTTQLVNSTDFLGNSVKRNDGSVSNVVKNFEENQFLTFKESDIVTSPDLDGSFFVLGNTLKRIDGLVSNVVESGGKEVISATPLVADNDNHGLSVNETVVCDGVSETVSQCEKDQFFNGPEIETQLENFTDCDCSGEILGKSIEMNDRSVSNMVEFEETASKFEENQFFKGPEIETVFNDSVSNVLEYGLKVGNGGSSRCSLKLELMDETALFDSLPVPKKDKNLVSFAKNTEKREKQEVMDVQREKRVRRRGKGRKKSLMMNVTENYVTQNVEAFSNGCEKIGDLNKKMYSRKEMEAIQYMNVKEQKKKWYEVYCGLGPIAVEYDDLHFNANQKRISVDFDPRQRFGKYCEAAALPDDEMDDENYTALEEECDEDSEGDGYYESMHRPALYVDGEPDFDSGPAEDGLEYLRRVRWETARVPKVKVAKIDRNKLTKEQSLYMPNIPEIAKCPEHLLPSKQWEDEFLADFEAMRVSVASLDESCPEKSVDVNSGDLPTLSTILGMDSVARVSMLRRRISSIEDMTTLSRTECEWLFALCVAVDSPLDADMSASLRCLLRKVASLRAEKLDLDDEAIMLNILATISGSYFRQAE